MDYDKLIAKIHPQPGDILLVDVTEVDIEQLAQCVGEEPKDDPASGAVWILPVYGNPTTAIKVVRREDLELILAGKSQDVQVEPDPAGASEGS